MCTLPTALARRVPMSCIAFTYYLRGLDHECQESVTEDHQASCQGLHVDELSLGRHLFHDAVVRPHRGGLLGTRCISSTACGCLRMPADLHRLCLLRFCSRDQLLVLGDFTHCLHWGIRPELRPVDDGSSRHEGDRSGRSGRKTCCPLFRVCGSIRGGRQIRHLRCDPLYLLPVEWAWWHYIRESSSPYR